MTSWGIRGRSLRVIRHAANPRSRLICFPHAGAGPSMFNEWPNLLPADVEVLGVVYPGRECRAQERPLHSLGRIVDEVADELDDMDDLPNAFFGHSMGAYAAFELTQRTARTSAHPHHLFVSGAGAPHMPAPIRLHELPTAEFFRALVNLNGFPPEILAERELIAMSLPILRADFTACETHRFNLDAPLRCPMTAFGGTRDVRVERDRLEGWRQLAALSFDLRMFEGDHFFVRPHRRDVVAHVGATMRGLA